VSSIIKSKDFKEIIYSTIQKSDSEPLSQKDLNRVKSITLQSTRISGKPTDVIPKEIALCTYLEHLIVNGFEIDDSFVDALNRLKNLKTIQFSECTFLSQKDLKKFLDFKVFDRCENVEHMARRAKKIKIIGQDKSPFDLNDLGDLSGVQELDLNNLDITNISRVAEIEELEVLNLSGSSIDNVSSIAQLPIKTKLNDEYLIL